MMKTKLPLDIRALMLGQITSQIGTQMTWFAVGIWLWRQTNSATDLMIVGAASTLCRVFFSFFAGAIVDRSRNRTLFVASDLALASSIATLFVLYHFKLLTLWTVLPFAAVSGIAESLLYTGLPSLAGRRLPKEDFLRFNGWVSLIDSSALLLAPLLAGALMSVFDLHAVLLFDAATSLFAVSAALGLKADEPTCEPRRSSIWKDAIFGLQIISSRRELVLDLLRGSLTNFFATIGIGLITPVILAKTAGDETVTSFVRASMGLGGISAGLCVAKLPLNKSNRILWMNVFAVCCFLFGLAPIAFGSSIQWWVTGGFLTVFFIPLIGAFNATFWQERVSAEYQGRVASGRRLIIQLSIPFAMLVSGPLVDDILTEPQITAPFQSLLAPIGLPQSLGILLAVTLGSLVSFAFYSLPEYRRLDNLQKIID